MQIRTRHPSELAFGHSQNRGVLQRVSRAGELTRVHCPCCLVLHFGDKVYLMTNGVAKPRSPQRGSEPQQSFHTVSVLRSSHGHNTTHRKQRVCVGMQRCIPPPFLGCIGYIVLFGAGFGQDKSKQGKREYPEELRHNVCSVVDAGCFTSRVLSSTCDLSVIAWVSCTWPTRISYRFGLYVT